MYELASLARYTYHGILVLSLLPLVASVMDARNFASATPPVLLGFSDPGLPPPSFIYSADQVAPPYDVTVETLDPAYGCSNMEAALCAVKHSIRLVTRARWYACPELEAGGARRAAALEKIDAGNFSQFAKGAQGFEVFIFDESDLTILADGLRPDLVGQRLDGFNASGAIPMPSLKAHIDWVARWGGGFVPHFSARLVEETSETLPVATYVEKCPGSDDYIGVSFGRDSMTTADNCPATSNAECAWRNTEAILGRMIVEFLIASDQQQMSRLWYEITFGENAQIKQALGFYGIMAQLSWMGYPGDDDYKNPSPLHDTMDTQVANGNVQAMLGCNISTCLPSMASWEQDASIRLSNNAWRGGGIQEYTWLGATKVTQTAGVVWNYTSYYMISGTSFAPESVIDGPLCSECTASSSLVCAVMNARSLAAHARMEMMVPDRNWSSLTNNPWFGASHVDAYSNEYSSSWPVGFYVRAFSVSTGLCVADGADPSNIGKSAAEIFGNNESHELLIEGANSGGNWVAFREHSLERLASVQHVLWNGDRYYIASALTRAMTKLSMQENCSTSNAEDCSNWNAQAVLGLATTELLSQKDIDSFAEVVRSIVGKTGVFSFDEVGDVQVYVYDSDFACWAGAKERGIPCSPDLSIVTVLRAEGQLASQDFAAVTTSQAATYVYALSWKPASGLEYQEFRLAVSVTATPIEPLCNYTADCPEFSTCSANGRCECDSGYLANISVMESSCGGYSTNTMTCVYVKAMDCTDEDGQVDLSRCRGCREGYFCNGISSPCVAGQYCPANSSSPTVCPAGSYSASTLAVECTPCPTGTASPIAASKACFDCPAGTYAGSRGQVSCSICPAGSYSGIAQDHCTACPGISLTAAANAQSIEECRSCPDGFYMDSGSCQGCGWGMIAPDLNATGCSIDPVLEGATVAFIVLFVGSGVLIVWLQRRYNKRFRQLQAKEDAATEALVDEAIESVLDFSHPMVLMSAELFLRSSLAAINSKHEGNRDAKRLVFLDSLETFKEFQSKDNKVVYLSYEIPSSGTALRPQQLHSMQEALAEVIARNKWPRDSTYLWLDIVSTPQDHAELKRLAQGSMFMYTRCSHAFLMVTPTLEAAEGHKRTDRESFLRQARPRFEVLAYCCANGPEQVYMLDDDGLELLSLQKILPMTKGFEAEFRCCCAGHAERSEKCDRQWVVQQLAGLYYEGARNAPNLLDPTSCTGNHFFSTVVRPEKETYLPSTFVFEYGAPSGSKKKEVRDLFRTVLPRLDRRVAQQPPTDFLEAKATSTRI